MGRRNIVSALFPLLAPVQSSAVNLLEEINPLPHS